MKRLNLLWRGYAERMLSSQQQVASAAMSLDLHGCDCNILHSKNPLHANMSGVIFKTSSTMWHVVTEDDKCISCAKSECDIQFVVGMLKITLLATGR